jgi:hypothetical protein
MEEAHGVTRKKEDGKRKKAHVGAEAAFEGLSMP